MLCLADWSVVALGGVAMLAGAVLLRWAPARARQGTGDDRGFRSSLAWFPVLVGAAMATARLPHLLGAPSVVLGAADAVQGVLMLTAAVVAFRAARRIRSHDVPPAPVGPSPAGQG
ncbi:hypothetical protein [Peterkaempfera sp. SMS 1(5)a]|uniref:hypothetical protein n=1 Tax=Peterkaempfera podocarpi TaxID=3232308 RepID=UPI003672D2DA